MDSNMFDQYQQSVAKFGVKLGKEMDIAHSILGMASEYGELMEALFYGTPLEIMEEWGDLFWFMAWFCTSEGRSFGDAVELAREHRVAEDTELPLFPVSALLTQVKKVLCYKAEDYDHQMLSEEFLALLGSILHLSARMEDFDMQQVLEANYNKLSARYPEGQFSQDSALNRDVDSEYAAMTSPQI